MQTIINFYIDLIMNLYKTFYPIYRPQAKIKKQGFTSLNHTVKRYAILRTKDQKYPLVICQNTFFVKAPVTDRRSSFHQYTVIYRPSTYRGLLLSFVFNYIIQAKMTNLLL